MKNKTLEALLKKNKHKHLIKLIERCENGKIVEIRAIKEELMTQDKRVDTDVLGYLKELNVKITFVKEIDVYKAKNRFYKEPKSCSNDLHRIVENKNIEKNEKIKLLEEIRLGLFKIDEQSYACCPECSKIVSITHF